MAGLLLGAALLIGALPAHTPAMKTGGCGTTREHQHAQATPATAHHHETAPPKADDHVISGAPGTCDHCPAERCAGLAPCSGTALMLGALPPAIGAAQPTHPSTRAVWQPALSQFFQPPTPPPTRIL